MLEKYIKNVAPAISMMVFMSLYTIVDGAFVALCVGADALAGLNIAYPLNNLILGVGIMFATGSNAVVATLLGAGKKEEANRKFTMSVVVAVLFGIVLSALMAAFFQPLLYLLGADETVYEHAFWYGIVVVIAGPLVILKEVMVSYLRVDGQPNLSLFAVVLGGVLNIILDFLFVYVLHWGVFGASLATALGILAGALLALGYFFSHRAGLKFCRYRWHGRSLWKMMSNGSSEMVNQLSLGITTLVYNVLAMRFFGADGVAAVTIVMYAEFIFVSMYLGLSMGIAPLISFYHGAEEPAKNQWILRTTGIVTAISSVALFALAYFCPGLILMFFTQEGTFVYTLAQHGLAIYAISLFFSGWNIIASGLFTAFGNGPVSAIIAGCRSCLFLLGGILLLSQWFGFDGLWLALPLAEGLTAVVAIICLLRYRKTYQLW